MKNSSRTKESIELLDGRIVECFPREGKIAVNPSEMSLDTTGKFLSVNPKGKGRRGDFLSEEERRTLGLLNENAWTLYENRERIYSDSRMFLAPADTGCHLAYTGRNGFENVVLGVWLEWWEAMEEARKDETGNDRLITFFAGSPLTGRNTCDAVFRDGRTGQTSVGSFKGFWQSFQKINRRYSGAGQRYSAYTLEEVVRITGGQERWIGKIIGSLRNFFTGGVSPL